MILNIRIGIFALLASMSLRAFAADQDCWSAQSSAELEKQSSPAVRIALPVGSIGPHTEADTSDYRWDTPLGTVWVNFRIATSDLRAKKYATTTVGTDKVTIYKWRDYSNHDVLVAEWPAGSSIDRPVVVTIPVDWTNCESISTARAIIDSVKFINNSKRIRAESLTHESGVWSIVFINELGERRRVGVGDVVTWDNGAVSSIDPDGLAVRNYDWQKGVWREVRIAVSEGAQPPSPKVSPRDPQ